MPDCLLVLEGRRAGALGYSDVRGHTSTTRFIESSDPPPDSRVVGQTWEYVNKDGGPDRRFASNRELAVCEYGRLRLASDAGLTEEFQTSRPDVFPAFIAAIRGMAQVAPHEERPPDPTAGVSAGVRVEDAALRPLARGPAAFRRSRSPPRITPLREKTSGPPPRGSAYRDF
jgi:hypothetical protein